MLRAAVCPCRSATTQCSIRRFSPVWASGQRAMSPAAKIPGTLVSRYSFTATPRSVFRPARSANWIRGRTPMPTTTSSAGSVAPPLSLTLVLSIDVARAQRRGDLESDEACPDHDRAPRRLRLGDDGARIAERAQHVDVRLVGAGNIEANGFG